MMVLPFSPRCAAPFLFPLECGQGFWFLLLVLLQVLSLGYYVISFFPGGAAGLRFLTSTFTATFRGIVGI